MNRSEEKMLKDLPFEINPVSDRLIMEAHGIEDEDVDVMMDSFISQMNNQVKPSEMEPGKSIRTAAINRNYQTTQGLKDIILYVYIENIGTPYDEEYNQLKGTMLQIEIVEANEVTDNYLDFMNVVKKMNESK